MKNSSTGELSLKGSQITKRLTLAVCVPMLAVLFSWPLNHTKYAIGSRALIYDDRAQYFIDPDERIQVIYSNLEEGRGLAYDARRPQKPRLIVADAWEGILGLELPDPVPPADKSKFCPGRHCISVDHGGLQLDRNGDLLLSDTHEGRLVVRDAVTFEVKHAIGNKLFRNIHDVAALSQDEFIVSESDINELDAEGKPTHGALYRIRTNQVDEIVKDGLSHPVGLALSPGERRLYVADFGTEMKRWLYFEESGPTWTPAGVLWSERIAKGQKRPALQDMAIGTGRIPDKKSEAPQEVMKQLTREAVFAAGLDGLYIFHPDGTLMAKYVIGDTITGVTWGEEGVLYLTSGRRIGRLLTRARAVSADWPASNPAASTSASTSARLAGEKIFKEDGNTPGSSPQRPANRGKPGI
jgi:sugar lactone lactonase YvrE